MKARSYYGAVLSLYGDDFRIDEDKMRTYIRFLITHSIQGFFPCGTTGEYVDLLREDLMKVLRIVLEESRGNIPVIPCASTASFRSTVRLIHDMEEIGIRQVAVCPPYYTPLRQKDIVDYYLGLLNETGSDLFLYNIPSFTNEISMSSFERLAGEKRIRGIKDSSGNMKTISRYIAYVKERRDDFSILTGTDEIILPALAAGCSGSVSALSAVVPEAHNCLYQYAFTDHCLAGRIQDELVNLAVLCEKLIFPTGYKLALAERGIDVGPPAQNVVERKQPELLETLRSSIRQSINTVLTMAGEAEHENNRHRDIYIKTG